MGPLAGFGSLVRDEIEAARQRCISAEPALHDPELVMQRWCLVLLEAQLALYQSDAAGLSAQLGAIGSLLDDPTTMPSLWRATLLTSRAKLGVALVGAGGVGDLLAQAEADIAEASALQLPCLTDALQVVSGCIAMQRGDSASAIAALDAVLQSSQAQAQPLLLASALRRRAELGRARVAGLVQHAEGMLRERGVVDPARLARLFTPGLPPPPE
jgi:hypothetical protein